jgi:hypothetical protein
MRMVGAAWRFEGASSMALGARRKPRLAVISSDLSTYVRMAKL